MAVLLFLLALIVLAALAPTLGRDSSDSRSEAAHDDRGWWPAGPDVRPHPHF
jgi:hypothetical protein